LVGHGPKQKNEKVSIPIPTQSLIHGFFRFLWTKQFFPQFLKTFSWGGF
jgi:hypothetical protein